MNLGTFMDPEESGRRHLFGILGALLAGTAFQLTDALSKPPGQTLARMAGLFPERLCCEVLEPTIRDMLDEYREALTEFETTGRNLYFWKACVAVARGYWSFWTAVVALSTLAFANWILKLWKAV